MKIKTKSGEEYIIYDDFVFQRINCKPGEFNIGQIFNSLEETVEYLNNLTDVYANGKAAP